MGLLSLLAQGPAHGYGLRADFERRTGATWPLNIGQVYTTLQRLERDALVMASQPATDGQIRYSITDSGRALVGSWFGETVERQAPQRDELVIKLALAASAPDVDVRAVISRQRAASMRVLRELTKPKITNQADTDSNDAVGRALALEAHIFHIEAELRWLDYVESVLVTGKKLKRSHT